MSNNEDDLLRINTDDEVSGAEETGRSTRSTAKKTTKRPKKKENVKSSAILPANLKMIAAEVATLFKSTVQAEIQKALGNVINTNTRDTRVEVHAENIDECVGPSRIKNPYARYVYSRDCTKTDYKLTKNSRYDLWLDLLRAELNQNKLLDVIDDKFPPNRVYSDEEQKERRASARFLIINKIDALYHNTVVDENDPKKMLALIMEQKRAEQNIGSAALRHIINTIKFEKTRENVHDFNQKFEDLIRRHGMTTAVMSDEEKRDAYQNAIKEAYPSILTVVVSRQGQITYEELKLITTAFEQTEKQTLIQNRTPHITTAMVGKVYKTYKNPRYGRTAGNNFRGRIGQRGGGKYSGTRCYNCGDIGHLAEFCRNKIKCYECDDFVGHTTRDCPRRQGYERRGRGRGRNNYNSNTRSRGRTNYERKTETTRQQRPWQRQNNGRANVAITHHRKAADESSKGE